MKKAIAKNSEERRAPREPRDGALGKNDVDGANKEFEEAMKSSRTNALTAVSYAQHLARSNKTSREAAAKLETAARLASERSWAWRAWPSSTKVRRTSKSCISRPRQGRSARRTWLSCASIAAPASWPPRPPRRDRRVQRRGRRRSPTTLSRTTPRQRPRRRRQLRTRSASGNRRSGSRPTPRWQAAEKKIDVAKKKEEVAPQRGKPWRRGRRRARIRRRRRRGARARQSHVGPHARRFICAGAARWPRPAALHAVRVEDGDKPGPSPPPPRPGRGARLARAPRGGDRVFDGRTHRDPTRRSAVQGDRRC